MPLPTYLTFDCYGTLVDFALDPVTVAILGPRAAALDVAAFLHTFEDLRYQEVLGVYHPYREVLCRSFAAALRQYGPAYHDADGEALVAAVPTFGPFAEVPAVLARLRRHCKLAIISNTDDELIARNVERIGVPFDRVITAQQARAYKPSPAIFQYALRELGCEAGEILHVAQGFTYDIIPAHDLGWARVWINRSHQPGDAAYGPYRELPDLSGLPALLGL